MPRDHFLDALTILGTAEQSVLDVRLTAPQARAVLDKLDYLQRDNRTLRDQHSSLLRYASGETETQRDLHLGETDHG